MLIDQGNLLKGMGMLFIKEFMNTAREETHEGGVCLFSKGDPTHHFYSLIEGEVRLSIDRDAPEVYVIDEAGEIFGWSSLVGGDAYTATAVCAKPTHLLKFDRDALQRLLEKHLESGFLFYQRLSEMLGRRLLETYSIIRKFV